MLADLVSTKRTSESWTSLVLLNDANGAAYTQSGIDSISVSVYDLSSYTPRTDLWVGLTPAVSSVIFDTLQTSDGWDLPNGFNFKHTIAPADLSGTPEVGHTFNVIYTVGTILDGIRVIEHLVRVRA